MGDTRIDDDQLRVDGPWDALEGDGPGVDEQRLTGAAEAARHLVHDADRRPDEIGLDPLRQTRHRVIVQGDILQRPEAAQQRDAERGAGRDAAADRNRRGDPRVEPLDLHAVIAQHPGDALHVVDPAAAGLLVAEAVGRGVTRQRGAVGPDAAALAAPEPHVRALRQHRRQHEALVVVGVLADQVDTRRRLRLRVRRRPEGPHERRIDCRISHGCPPSPPAAPWRAPPAGCPR
jgi:hypothetical protein